MPCDRHRREEKRRQGVTGKREAKRSLGRPESKWEGNFKIDVKGIGWAGFDWICLALGTYRWSAATNMAVNSLVP